MPKRARRPRPTPAPAAPGRARRDPITRLTRFCEILALGLVAASLFLNFANPLSRPGSPPVSLDYFPGLLQKSAILAVHTRTPWVTLALAGMVVSVVAYRRRPAPMPHPFLKFSPLFLLLVLSLHAGAQAYLQSQGPLHIAITGPAPRELNLDLGPLPIASTSTGPNTSPAILLRATTVRRFTIPEGTPQQWSFLFVSDLLYGVPILLTWILALAPASFRISTGENAP